jgi:hypothetical protein
VALHKIRIVKCGLAKSDEQFSSSRFHPIRSVVTAEGGKIRKGFLINEREH